MTYFFRPLLFVLMVFLLLPKASAQEPLDFADLVTQVEGSVANISTFPGVLPEGVMPKLKSQASGFFIRSDGFLVTTASVVDRSNESYVVSAGKKQLRAQLVGKDKITNVAVLKVESGDWQTIKAADMSKIRTGQRVLLVGSAFAGMNTVADGIISHFGEPSFPEYDVLPSISLSVPIHPGNSGAPIFNIRGEAVGMVSMLYTPAKDSPYSPITFAVPMDIVLATALSIIEYGRVVRGSIRLNIQEMTQELSKLFGLHGKPRGALVAGMDENGPAARAGMKLGDIILEFDRKPVEHATNIRQLVNATAPGSKVPVMVFRNGKTIELSAEIEELRNGQ